jgi:hypothetical protein
MTEKDAIKVLKKNRELAAAAAANRDNAKIEAETLIVRSKALIAAHARSEAAKGLLEMLPQGHGSGLDADMVDGLHAAEILAKARMYSGGGGSGNGGGDHNILSATHLDALVESVLAGDIIIGNATPKWSRLGKGIDGQYLKTVSGLPAWADPPGAADHNLLSTTHPDTLAAAVVRGDLLVGNSTPKWARLPKGAQYYVLVMGALDPVWALLTNNNIDAAAAIVESKLALNYPTHAAAHTLASHSSKAHSELTGVGENDHHTKFTITEHDTTVRHTLGTVVPHDALASLTEKSHTNLTDKGTNTHPQIDTHLAAAAPHSGHEATANKDQANGYAGLSAGSKLAASQMPTGKVKTTLSFAVTGTLTTGADKAPTIVAPCTLTITKVKLVVKTAPTGAAIIVDVNKNGTTIFTTQANRPSIAIGATTGDSGTPDVTGLAEGDKLTIDIDQVGSTIAGADLTIEVVSEQSVAFS